MRAGTLKAFAVAAKSRLPTASTIPTTEEAGLPGFYASLWYGMWAPKGTPTPIVSRLNGAVVEALAPSQVRSRLAELGLEIAPSEQQTPQALKALQQAEIAKWWPIIKAANIKAE